MTQRRTFLLKLFSLFGVATAVVQAPKLFQGNFLLNDEKDFTKTSYIIHDSLQARIRSVYKVDDFLALRKRYTDEGLLIDISVTRFTDSTRTTMTFNCPASRQKFMQEYSGNISKYKKV